jgi:hypothetical protein
MAKRMNYGIRVWFRIVAIGTGELSRVANLGKKPVGFRLKVAALELASEVNPC